MLELASLIAHHARVRPQARAVVADGESLSWTAFAERVARVANMLRALGVREGDKVATASANCLALLETYWAVPTIGATLVPLSPLLTASGLASLLAGAEVRCLVTQASMLPVLRELGDRLPPIVLVVDASDSGFLDYATLAREQPGTCEPARVGPDALFNIMYSSGTTGLPKGIMLTHFVRAMYALEFSSVFRMTPESRTLHTGAIVFNGAFVLMVPSFYLGGTYVLHRQFDAQATIETIERERITHLTLVPAQVVAMLQSPAYAPARLASLQCLMSLGAPLLQREKDRLNDELPGRLYELYGVTEGFMTILDRDDAQRKSRSVGTVRPFSRLRIVRDDGRDAAPGESGEIVGQGPMMMTGYYGRADLTAETIRDGWLHTGDIGRVDEDGFLYLVDRKKDMIDSGGVKVYPRDIEEIASRHPAIGEVAVFGVPHDKWGETPLAAVILRRGASESAEQLRDWINERVSARYQRVSEVVVMAEFPRSAAGKVLKREMRDAYWRGTGRAI